MDFKKMKFNIELKCIAASFSIIGIVLSIINFINNRSLWTDEATLSLNIINKPIYELLQPLDYNQVAPVGFLLVEKFFASLLGNTDWSLRIFPIISFFLSIFLIYSVTQKILKNKLFGLFTAAFFATSFITLSYSSEVKQYMTDITFGLLILLGTIIYNENGFKNKWWLYSILGIVSIWFSNVSILLLFSSGLYSMYKTYHSIEKKYLRLVITLGLWFFSFVIYYALFIYNHPTKDMMINYWQNAGGFMPQDILSADFYKSLFFKMIMFFSLLSSSMFTLLLAPLFLFGFFFLAKKKREILYLLVSPLILHLVLSYLQLYPFSKRLILYLYPSLLIIIFSGFFFIHSLLKGNQQRLLYILPLLLTANILLLIRYGFPIEKEEIKKSMSYLNPRLINGDNIYVYYGATAAFNFYKEQFNLKIDDADIILTSGNRNNWSNYQEPILKLNDSVWILFSHIYWIKNEEKMQEEEFILNIFRDEGYQIIDEQKYRGSSVYHAIRIMPKPNNVYEK